jgi:hypothetical protein
MTRLDLVHPQGTCQVFIVSLIAKCNLFKNNPMLLEAPYHLPSSVPLAALRNFVSALEDNPLDINDSNITGVFQLCDEMGFASLARQLSVHFPCPEFSDSQAAEIRSRLLFVEERQMTQECQVADLQSALSAALRRVDDIESVLGRRTSEFTAFRSGQRVVKAGEPASLSISATLLTTAAALTTGARHPTAPLILPPTRFVLPPLHLLPHCASKWTTFGRPCAPHGTSGAERLTTYVISASTMAAQVVPRRLESRVVVVALLSEISHICLNPL